MLHHRRCVVLEERGGRCFFSFSSFFYFIHSSEKERETEREREREDTSDRGGELQRVWTKKGGSELRGEGDWFRGINPLMLDVHAPAGTTSAGYVHPRDFHNLNCKSIRPPIAASEFMQSAPVPAIPFATPLEGDFTRISTRASDISRLLRPWKSFRDVEESPGCRRGEGRNGGVWNFC